MMISKNILFLSAADRWNLGDLLFPKVFQYYSNARKLEFTNVGLVSYNPDDIDILPVRSILDLKSANYHLVIGGGEVLNIDLVALLAFINPSEYENAWINALFSWYQSIVSSRPSYLMPLHLRILRRLLIYLMNCQYGIRSSRLIPFFVSSLPSARRFYLPVGGKFPPVDEALISKSYQNTSMIAARDKRTRDSFHLLNQKCALIPDPVATIAEIFPRQGQKKKQVVFQFTKEKLPFGLNRLVEILSLFQEMGYSTVGLAIGRCPGHHDISSLQELKSLRPSLEIITESSVRDAINVLASSEVYIGTSLHGAIIAHSYGNAVIGMDEAVIKLSDYLDTWMSEFSFHLSASTLDSEICAFLDDFNFPKAKLNADRLSALAQNYINEVLDDIEESLVLN